MNSKLLSNLFLGLMFCFLSNSISGQNCLGPLSVMLTGASTADSIQVDVEAIGISCSTEETGNINLIVNGGNGGYEFEWADGSMESTFRDSLSSGSYSVTITDSQGCEEVIETMIDLLSPANSDLAENPGCGNCILDNGSSTFFFNQDADYIAELLDDPSDMVDLGDTEVCLQTQNEPGDCYGSPFLERQWSITPNESGLSCMKLFFTQDEFENLSESLPDSPTPTPEFLVENDRMCITGYTGGLESCSDYESAKIYSQTDADPLKVVLEDSTEMIWSVEVCLSEYATFYFHVCALPLPVSLISFFGEKEGKDNLIYWRTEQESNIKRYLVEVSRNGKSWKTLDEQSALNTGEGVHKYETLHRRPGKGIQYYRLKIEEFDGSIGYSDVVAISRKSSYDEQFYPNVFSSSVTFQTDLKKSEHLDFEFFNENGRTAHKASVFFEKGLNEFVFDLGHIAAGAYFVSVTSQFDKEQRVYKLLKTSH